MSATLPEEEMGVTVEEMTVEEGRRLLDKQARRTLGIKGDEFVRRWNAGAYEGQEDCPGVTHVSLFLPLANGAVSKNGRT